MTVPLERTRSVLDARQLLNDLAQAQEDADLKLFRNRARALLRHYPEAYHLQQSAGALPGVWADPTEKW